MISCAKKSRAVKRAHFFLECVCQEAPQSTTDIRDDPREKAALQGARQAPFPEATWHPRAQLLHLPGQHLQLRSVL